ncbi:Ribonuclease Z [uncultured archaeon]|nr:Ribonuclease Z [uncultured archaeon]
MMDITFLGTAASIPTAERSLPAVIITHLNEPFLFDCGEGSQRQMRIADINFMRINRIFITHLHADHFMGLGGLIQSMDFLERDRDLHIYGPRGIKETVNHLLSAGSFALDAFTIQIHEVDEGLVWDGEKITVTAAKTRHNKNSLAYRIEEKPHKTFLKQKALQMGIPEGPLFSKLQDGHTIEVAGKKIKPEDVLSEPVKGRSIVYTGDTAPAESVVELAKDADILIHEATLSANDIDHALADAHSTTTQAAEVAKKAGVKKLYLTHISQRYPDQVPLEEEARKIFQESYVAYDLLKVHVDKHW